MNQKFINPKTNCKNCISSQKTKTRFSASQTGPKAVQGKRKMVQQLTDVQQARRTRKINQEQRRMKQQRSHRTPSQRKSLALVPWMQIKSLIPIQVKEEWKRVGEDEEEDNEALSAGDVLPSHICCISECSCAQKAFKNLRMLFLAIYMCSQVHLYCHSLPLKAHLRRSSLHSTIELLSTCTTTNCCQDCTCANKISTSIVELLLSFLLHCTVSQSQTK